MTDIIARLERQWAALDPVDEYRADARDAITEIVTRRGAQAAADERLANAAQRVGITAGCDAPEWMADEIERLRAELGALRGQGAEPMAWLIDWPDDPELGHLFAGDRIGEGLGRSRPLYLAPQPAIPEGFVLVPKKLTPAMCDALRTGSRRDVPGNPLCGIRWAAALAAAPKPGDAK